MILTINYLFLQQYWWFIISLLLAFLVFLLFVQGGQTLIQTIGKNIKEQNLIVNSLGRKWEFTYTTLVVFGGAFFASFPLFYSTSFGGAYWLWMCILFCFVIQAISYEYRSKPNNFLGKKTYDVFLFINGSLGTFLLGVAVATFFTGANFTINFANIFDSNEKYISQWTSPWHGLEALSNWHNLIFGLTIFFLARTLALLYFINNIEHIEIVKRSKKHLIFNAIPFVIFFILFLIIVFTTDNYAYEPNTKLVYIERYKYLMNFIDMPVLGIMLIVGICLVLYGIILSLFTQTTKGIWYSGSGVIITVLSLSLSLGLNNTCYYPSLVDMNSSLHIQNSSSSYFTLKVMSYASLLVPFVAAYMYWAWKVINSKKITDNELNESGHVY